MIKIKFNIDSLFNYSLILFLILLSGSVFHVGFFTPTYLIGMLFSLLSLIYYRNYKKHDLLMFAISLFFISLIFFTNYLFSLSSNFKDYSIILLQILFSALSVLSLKVRNVDVKYYLYNLLRILILLSFVGVFVSILNVGNRVDIGGSGYAVYTFLYLFYYFADVSFGSILLYRNQGIFWEPGILSIYANIFLFLSLFVYKNTKSIFFAVLCILSTMSTTGILLLIIQFIIYLKKEGKGIVKKAFLIILLIIPVVIMFGISLIGKKVEGEEQAISSFGLRSFDLYTGAMVSIDNPFFGVGLNKEMFIKERNKFLPAEMEAVLGIIEDRGNSNSLMMLFYSMGFIIALFILYIYYNQTWFVDHRNLFFFMLLISFSSEPLIFTPFFLCLMISGFHNIIRIKL